MSGVILVGVDEREPSRDAVALGAALAEALHDELVLLHVYPYDPLAESLLIGQMTIEDVKDQSLEIVRKAAEDAPPGTRTLIAPSTSVVAGLHDEAERLGAEMIVIGSSGRGAIGRILLGSHTERVLHSAPCAVAVAPRGLRERGWTARTVAVGFDGSDEARQALEVARRIAASTGATVRLVWVVNAPRGPWRRYRTCPPWEEYEQRGRQEAEARLAEVAAEGEDTEIRTGDPVDELVAVSADVDLLALGSRRYGPVKRLMLGTTADKVVRDAACPVVAVPRGVREERFSRSTGEREVSRQPGA